MRIPLRVDFAGGWLDVPRFARKGAYIVNCAISPLVSLEEWPYECNGGLGGSAAWAMLHGKDPIESELEAGVGWQDPAVIRETGLCVWKSGPLPELALKGSHEFLRGRMALYWTGKEHNTPNLVGRKRDYHLIEQAGRMANNAAWTGILDIMAAAVRRSYTAQLLEGMASLSCTHGEIAKKYCGSGWGGYALYLFEKRTNRDRACGMAGFRPVEPYVNE